MKIYGAIDYEKKTKDGIPLSNDPIPITVLKIGDNLVIDPLPQEEEAAVARITIAITDERNFFIVFHVLCL